MGGIFDKLRQTVRRNRTGRRFQDRYEAARAARKDARWSKRAFRVLRILVALCAMGIGAILAFIPGPAIPFFILAGGLLSAESRSIARLLDWGEGRMWVILGWVRRMPVWGQTMFAVLVACLGAGLVYASYRLVMN